MTRPIRTLLFSTLYPSASRPLHGIFVETRLRQLLSTGAVQTRVVAPVPWFPFTHRRWGERARMAATPSREIRNGIDVRHPRYPVVPKVGMTIAPALLALAAASAVQEVLDEGFDFDVIDAHYYYPDGIAAAWLARRFGKPLAITARGTDLNLIPRHALPRRMIAWAARQADASIGVCAALVALLHDLGAPADRLHVMRNGVDLQLFRPVDPHTARSALGVQGQPLLLSVGNLVDNKGHDMVIEALAVLRLQCPEARLAIVGDGPLRAQLQACARRHGVQDRVTFAGLFEQQQLVHWYSAADVLVLASSREGWANVLLESMSCGTPVVTTAVGGSPEVVCGPDAGTLVAHRDAHSVAQGILSVWKRRPDRRAVRRYAEGFGWQATSDAQVRLFSQLGKVA
jgi:glycosyltransferase involved in cell wall biosynthesis